MSDEIEDDEQYRSKNLKSNKMSRYEKHWKSSGLSVISHHKIYIITILDSYNNLKMKNARLGPVSTIILENTMNNFVTINSLLITDLKTAYIKFCKYNKLILEQIPSWFHNTDNGHNIQKLNNVHSKFNIWLSNFKEVSIRYHKEFWSNFYVWLW